MQRDINYCIWWLSWKIFSKIFSEGIFCQDMFVLQKIHTNVKDAFDRCLLMCIHTNKQINMAKCEYYILLFLCRAINVLPQQSGQSRKAASWSTESLRAPAPESRSDIYTPICLCNVSSDWAGRLGHLGKP